MSLAKKLKMIVKGERKPTFGTDPNEPWSVRAGITESETSMLGSYLKSRGINPEFVSKDTKISHAKSTEFSKWKRDHNFDDPADYVSSTARDAMKSQREETIPEAKTIQGTALDKFRQAAAERARKHDDIERAMKARHAAGKEDMKGSIDRLEKQLSKEETVVEGEITKTKTGLIHRGTYGTEYTGRGVEDSTQKDSKDLTHLNKQRTKNLEKGMDVHFSKIKEESGASKETETKFHKKLDKLVHSTFGKRKDEMKKEEVEELDEISKDTLKSYADKAPRIGNLQNKKGEMRVNQRHKGVQRAMNRLYPMPTQKEEVDITEKNDSHTHAAHYEDPKTGEWTGMNLLIAKDDDDAIRQANEKCKEGCRLTKVERHITVKEETEHKVGDSVTVNSKFFGKQKGKVTKIDNQSIHVQRNDKKTSEKYPHDAVVKEESEQIDELKKSTVFSWLKQQPVVPVRKPGIDRVSYNQKVKNHSKSWNRALDRLSGYKPTSEDVFQDTQAATQTAFDMGTQADDREPTYSKKKEMSKSARIIKSLYKHNNMKEDIYDHEKEDKSVATYGKKPKVEIVGIDGDEDNQAAMVLKGGRTLTGQERDTLEIDPVMRKPTNPEIRNSNKKTDK